MYLNVMWEIELYYYSVFYLSPPKQEVLVDLPSAAQVAV